MITHPDPSMPYTQSEIDSFKNYWDDGGSLLLVGCSQDNSILRSNDELNRVISELNIDATFSGLEAGGYNTSLEPYFVTTSVESIFVRGAKIEYTNNDLFTALASTSGAPYFVAYENEVSDQRAILLGGLHITHLMKEYGIMIYFHLMVMKLLIPGISKGMVI